MTPILTEDEVINIRKHTSPKSTKPWADTIAFERAVEEAVSKKLSVTDSFTNGTSTPSAFVVEDLTKLRDELAIRAFDQSGQVSNATLAEVVFKINSCLFKGYPQRDSLPN